MATQKKKSNTAGGGLYIALAICILSVICIGVYSAIINIFDTTTTNDPGYEENGNKVPSVTDSPLANIPIVSQNPEKNEDLDVGENLEEEEPEQNVNANPTPPTYTLPIAGAVSKEFSGEVLVYSETMNDYRVHVGVDLAGSVGTPVKAFTDGVVLEIFEDPLMGQTVVLDHGNGMKSVYQNLSPQLPEDVVVGAKVSEGQVIGGVGETGLIECAQESHVHFEVKVDDVPVNPMEYFQ